MHSLENIVEAKENPVRLFTPIAEEILVVIVLACLWVTPIILEDYLYSGSVCPVGTVARRAVAMFDAGAFYLLKGPLMAECTLEDGYWRLFSDGWVRNVITDSDAMALLLASAFRAWVFKEALGVTLVPALAFVFSIFFMVCSTIENILPRTPPLVYLENIIRKLNILPFETAIPPDTQPRQRQMQDFVEGYEYWKGRYVRRWSAFYDASAVALTALISAPLKYVFCFRVVAIFVPQIGMVLREILLRVGFKPLITLHLGWFKDSIYLDVTYSEGILWAGVQQAWNVVTSSLILRFLAPSYIWRRPSWVKRVSSFKRFGVS